MAGLLDEEVPTSGGGGLRSVGELGDGRCDMGLEPEVRFVFYHVSGEQEREETPCEFVPFETEMNSNYRQTADKKRCTDPRCVYRKNKDRPVEGFPKAQEDRPVQMAPVAAELQDGHVPLLNIGVRLRLVILQMKGSN